MFELKQINVFKTEYVERRTNLIIVGSGFEVGMKQRNKVLISLGISQVLV